MSSRPAPQPLRALIYTRVSLDPRHQGRSVAEQEAECRAWADREGWTVVDVITETGSASRYARSTRARTRWAEVTDALAAGDHDILLVWEASRATRDLTDYTTLRDLAATHGVLLGYSGTIYDLRDRSDRFRTGLDALLSEDEAARTSERVKRAVRARATAGTPHGKIPYGYRREYDPATGALLRQVPDETTAPIVAEITRRVGDGEPLYAIARDLTARGIPLPRPARSRHNASSWIPTTIKRLATSPVYIAQRVHQGQIVGPATWPPLVTPEQQARAAAELARKPAGNPTGDGAARHLLSGIARCGVCGGPMRHWLNRGYHSYSCGWCYKVTRPQAKVDAHVLDRLAALLEAAPMASTDTGTEEADRAEADLRALEERLEDFLEQGIAGTLSPASVAKAEARLLPQINAAAARARALRAPSRLARYDLEDPRLIERMDVPQLRELIRDTVAVTILPVGAGHRTFAPESVVVTPIW